MSILTNYNRVYEAAFPCIRDMNINSLPVSVDKLTEYLNIETIPLSRYINEGFSEKQIFEIWGNEDGVVQKSCVDNKIKISYNDGKHPQRQRFTIVEECSHILLNHLDSKSFNIFDQRYSFIQYEQCEVEARACAGLLLLPPNFYYDNLEYLSFEHIADICDISLKCAKTRVSIYEKFRNVICYSMEKYGLKKHKTFYFYEPIWAL